MGLEDLSILEISEGLTSIIWVICGTIVGIVMILRTKQFNYILTGIAWILMCSPWWASSIQFIIYITMNQTLDEKTYLLLTNVGITWGLLCWIYVFCVFAYPEWKNKLVLIYFIIVLVYQVLFLYLLFTNTKLIGTLTGLFNVNFGIIPLCFMIFGLLSILVTGIIFSRKSMKMDDPNIKWRGRFLLIAFILYTIGAMGDAAIPVESPLLTVITRLILIISGIAFYFGFFLPKKIGDWLIKS